MSTALDEFSFDFEPTIQDLSQSIISTTDKLYHTLNTLILHMTASASIQIPAIPDPSSTQKNSVLQNPFVLNVAPPTSTTILSERISATRQHHITLTLNHDTERDKNTYFFLQQQLHELITQLYTIYPLPSSTNITSPKLLILSSDTPHTTDISLQSINIHNINSLPKPTIQFFLQALPLQPKTSFSSQNDYILYLKQYKSDLYSQVKQQHIVVEQLHKQAVSLQQSLSLYRGQ